MVPGVHGMNQNDRTQAIQSQTLNMSLAASMKCPALRYSSIASRTLFFSRRCWAYFARSMSISRTLWALASSMAVFHWFRWTQQSIACLMRLHWRDRMDGNHYKRCQHEPCLMLHIYRHNSTCLVHLNWQGYH